MRLRIWCEGDDFTLQVQITNVSRQGMFVRTAHPASLGQQLKVSMDEIDAVAHTEVRWSHHQVGDSRSGMGLAITRFERGQANYERYVEHCGSRSGEHMLNLTARNRRSSRPPPGGSS